MNHSASILIYACCFTMVFVGTWISKYNKSNRLFDAQGVLAAKSSILLGLHVAGISLLGLFPIILLKKSPEIILTGSRFPDFLWLIVWVLLLIVIVATGLRAGRNIQIYQQYRHGFSNKFLSIYFLLRILFLCSYELFFRGLLLFDCIKWLGIYPAILLTTFFTVLIHVFTNKKEMLGCIPFGIMLSCCCIFFNAVWPAIVLHVALSMAYEIPPLNYFLKLLKLSR